jgi:hypothetical protein
MKKEGCLHSPLHLAGTQTTGTDGKLPCLASEVNADGLEIDKPTTARVPIGVADGIARCRPPTAAITNSCHGDPSLN